MRIIVNGEYGFSVNDIIWKESKETRWFLQYLLRPKSKCELKIENEEKSRQNAENKQTLGLTGKIEIDEKNLSKRWK